MTSEGLGEMFGGDSADTCAGKFPLMLMGDERTVKRAQTVSEDPHRRERKFLRFNSFLARITWIGSEYAFLFSLCVKFFLDILILVMFGLKMIFQFTLLFCFMLIKSTLKVDSFFC